MKADITISGLRLWRAAAGPASPERRRLAGCMAIDGKEDDASAEFTSGHRIWVPQTLFCFASFAQTRRLQMLLLKTVASRSRPEARKLFPHLGKRSASQSTSISPQPRLRPRTWHSLLPPPLLLLLAAPSPLAPHTLRTVRRMATTKTPLATVGILSIGDMGIGIAKRLRATGFAVATNCHGRR